MEKAIGRLDWIFLKLIIVAKSTKSSKLFKINSNQIFIRRTIML